MLPVTTTSERQPTHLWNKLVGFINMQQLYCRKVQQKLEVPQSSCGPPMSTANLSMAEPYTGGQ